MIGRTDLLCQISRGAEDLDDLDLNPLLVQADPGSPGAITELASQFVADRRYAEAESLYRRALDANRRQSDVWNLLAYAQAWQGRFDDARKSVEEYDRLAPGDPNPADSRGEIEMLAGNLGAAQSWFLNSYHRDAKFNSGAALEKAALANYLSGNDRVAAQLLDTYLADREKAGDPLTAYTRARWQFLFGQSDAAQSALENAVRRGGPDAALAATRLMLAALRDGETEAARRWAGRRGDNIVEHHVASSQGSLGRGRITRPKSIQLSGEWKRRGSRDWHLEATA